MTPSDTSTSRSWPGKFSDGKTARGWPCRVRLDERGIIIARDEGAALVWPYGALRTPHPLSRGAQDAVITYTYMPEAQLFVGDAAFVAELGRAAPQLTTRAHRWRWATPLIAAAALVLAGFAVVWALELRPARAIAGLLPEQSRQAVGRNVVTSLAARHTACEAKAGRAALDALMARLLAGVARPDYFKITVLRWGVVNAFAAPGGQMVLTSGLIRAARSPEEVAGVLAHEIGHGVELHPETGLVRAVGLSALVELLTGGSSGTLSNIGALVLRNSYVRGDERAADYQALALLRQAGIAQSGLADFFERIGRRAGGKHTSGDASQRRPRAFGAFDLLRTHPYPEERAEMVRKSASYATRPALTSTQWRALKAICSK